MNPRRLDLRIFQEIDSRTFRSLGSINQYGRIFRDATDHSYTKEIRAVIKGVYENGLGDDFLDDIDGLKPGILGQDRDWLFRKHFSDEYVGLVESRADIRWSIISNMEKGNAGVVNLFGSRDQGKSFIANSIYRHFYGTIDIALVRFDVLGSEPIESLVREIASELGCPDNNSHDLEGIKAKLSRFMRLRRAIVIVDDFNPQATDDAMNWLFDLSRDCQILIVSNQRIKSLNNSNTIYYELGDIDQFEKAQIVEYIDKSGSLPKLIEEIITRQDHLGPSGIKLLTGLLSVDSQWEYIDNKQTIPLHIIIERHLGILKDQNSTYEMLKVATFFMRENSIPSVFDKVLFCAAGWLSKSDDDLYFRAIDLLVERGLLYRENPMRPGDQYSLARYRIEPLVGEFIESKETLNQDWIQDVKARLINWAIEYTKDTTYPNIKDPSVLEKLRDDLGLIGQIADWAEIEGRHKDCISIIDGLDRYYYIKGPWKEKFRRDIQRIASAKKLRDMQIKDSNEQVNAELEYVRAMTLHAQVLSTRGLEGDKRIIRRYLNKIGRIESDLVELRIPQLPNARAVDLRIQIEHARAFYAEVYESKEKARTIMRKCLYVCTEYPDKPRPDLVVATYRRLAAQLSEISPSTAREYLSKALQWVEREESETDRRSLIDCTLLQIELDRSLFQQADTYDKVRMMYFKAEEIGEVRYMTRALWLKGECELARRSYREAEGSFQEAFNKCDEYSILDSLRKQLEDRIIQIRELMLNAGA